ncbi:C1 family peptidase [Undibacterium amnicola]|uniref:C1 family peptidase n=1 Tax=Undibacterium amnicola TaxID=1834038 RepID=A0ABR6XSC7_9BURK|nr:C1 family peptidase [Undibacterium amnicola]MBC3832410.1 C1 family peptidase [Undibacterium amnicola]
MAKSPAGKTANKSSTTQKDGKAEKPVKAGKTGKAGVAADTAAEPARRFNARRDSLDFRDRMYVASLVEVPCEIPLNDYLKHKVPVLDQGAEGACTGFGLATVANYLLRRRQHVPDLNKVSPRMFYELARRYDEWPGENYDGSSARGAMKGWNKHGVCRDEEWPYHVEKSKRGSLNDARLVAARACPLGAYYRVNHKDLIAMHAAIADVGALYATSMVHAGWQAVGADGEIKYSPDVLGGHAFAIVAYDSKGFWIQNSWGSGWGKDGMGHVSYDDWLENGTDVWVARLGAPVVLNKPLSFATAHASGSGMSVAYTYSDLRPHLISLGNQGRFKPGGDYGTSDEEVTNIFKNDIPTMFNASTKKKRLLLFAHGGLVSADAAVQRVAEYRGALLAEGVYPLAFIWNTDYWSTLTNMLQDAVRRRRPEGFLDKAKDFMLDRFDDALEPLARTMSGKAAWSEMKENALAASGKDGGARRVVQLIIALTKQFPDLELHVVGHSAGSILHAPLIQLLASKGVITSGPMKGQTGANLSVATCTLWAPACTAQLFKSSYLPLIENGQIGKFAMYSLSDTAEQSDNCARIYNKSLLYLVSNAFEETQRIPGFSEGVPILGMENTVKNDPDLKQLFGKSGAADWVIAPNDEAKTSIKASKARQHGAFDDDDNTVASTFSRILGAAPVKNATITIDPANLSFAMSATSLIRTRMDIDNQTKR